MEPRPGVLIVDDSKVVRAAIAKVIRGTFEAQEVGDGEAAWAAIERHQGIVAVISDLGMPKLDGFGLLARIRSSSSPRIRNMPFLVISGNEDDETRSRARTAGANDFISKSTKGVEAIARIDNLLRLAQAKQDLEASHVALKVEDDEKMWDPLTGAFSSAYLLVEGGKHVSHARRHGTALSAVSFRIDNYPAIEQKVGKQAAGQLLARIVKLVQETLRAEDSMGRTDQALFTIVSPSIAAEQAIAFARRLRSRLDSARITHGGEAISIRTSLGVAALGPDKVETIEDLLKAALSRLERVAAKTEAQRAAAPDDMGATIARGMPNDIGLAVMTLEKASQDRAAEVLDKLGPLVKTVCAKVGIELHDFVALLQARP
jgi:two-component system, cell cycle response regulator